MTDSGVSVARTFAGRQDAALRICHELRDGLDCLALVLAEMAELSASAGYDVGDRPKPLSATPTFECHARLSTVYPQPTLRTLPY